MPTTQQLVSYLRTNRHVGRTNAILARDIAAHFNAAVGDTEVPIRKVIRLAIEQGELIGSCRTGYFIIDSVAEIDSNLNSLRRRAEGILQRRRNLLSTWNTPRRTRNRTNLTDLTIR
jgi:hypothetical protein